MGGGSEAAIPSLACPPSREALARQAARDMTGLEKPPTGSSGAPNSRFILPLEGAALGGFLLGGVGGVHGFSA